MNDLFTATPKVQAGESKPRALGDIPQENNKYPWRPAKTSQQVFKYSNSM
jgi:hypothetical protein